MKKPELEKVIEKLKEADVREWETFKSPRTHFGPYFELKRCGLVFRLERRRDHPNSLSIENYDKNFHIVYKGPQYKINRLYDETSKAIDLYQQGDAAQRLGFLIYSEDDMGESSLERMITRLKELDIRAWKPDKFFDKKCPVFTTEVSGITFCISKGLIFGYGLEIKYNKESDKTIKLDYTKKPDKKHVQQLICDLYEKVYKELKEDEEREFEERLDNFLSG